MKAIRAKLQNKDGYALVIVIVIMLVFIILSSTLLFTASNYRKSSVSVKNNMQAQLSAEGLDAYIESQMTKENDMTAFFLRELLDETWNQGISHRRTLTITPSSVQGEVLGDFSAYYYQTSDSDGQKVLTVVSVSSVGGEEYRLIHNYRVEPQLEYFYSAGRRER